MASGIRSAKKVSPKDKQLIIATLQNYSKQFESDSPFLNQKFHRIGSLIVAQAKANIMKHDLYKYGGLINSIQYRINKNTLSVGSFGITYAAIHEYGGIIRPIKSKRLTIPLGREYERRHARTINTLFYIRSKRGKELLLDRAKDNQPAYLLLKQVKIRERPYLRPAIDLQMERILSIINE